MDAITVQGVSKIFKLTDNPAASLKERAIKFGRTKHRTFTALEPLDLTVATGETLGILGHNGSGKSTLLRCISGVIKPTTGEIRLRGRLAALLELGSGFHPDLSGRENVFINAAFLGISRKEITRRFDDIVDFSELHEFIDEPVKHYSSGMYVRLGFAVAINLEPDVLIIDEVLAVGDELFQRKCLDRVSSLQREGCTIVVVTHSAETVRRVCQRAIVLHHGKLVADDEPGEAIRIFREHLHGKLVDADVENSDQRGDSNASLKITRVKINRPNSDGRSALHPGEPLHIAVDYESELDVSHPIFTIEISTVDGQVVHAIDLNEAGYQMAALNRSGTINIRIPSVPLLDGTYALSFSLSDRDRPDTIAWRDGEDSFAVTSKTKSRGVVALEMTVEVN